MLNASFVDDLLLHWKNPSSALIHQEMKSCGFFILNPVLIAPNCCLLFGTLITNSDVALTAWKKSLKALYAASSDNSIMWHWSFILPPDKTCSPTARMCSTKMGSEQQLLCLTCSSSRSRMQTSLPRVGSVIRYSLEKDPSRRSWATWASQFSSLWPHLSFLSLFAVCWRNMRSFKSLAPYAATKNDSCLSSSDMLPLLLLLES